MSSRAFSAPAARASAVPCSARTLRRAFISRTAVAVAAWLHSVKASSASSSVNARRSWRTSTITEWTSSSKMSGTKSTLAVP